MTLTVELADHSYPIIIEPGVLERAGAVLAPIIAGGSCLVIADATVAACHAETLLTSLRSAGLPVALAAFPAGETSKSLASAEHLWQACAQHRIDRSGFIIALGGGVSGDLAGFVAATWMRGIGFIQIPTSLLAMVDSSVGGKTGINSASGKNLIGAFKQPRAVLVDPLCLQTIDARAYRAGLAEVLKYGVIRDADFFAWQEAHHAALQACAAEAVAEAVRVSCATKAWYVVADEFEHGPRKELNYGHTFGHALERETSYQRYMHGEAVAIGMRMAADCARRLGLLEDPQLIERQDALLRAYGLPLYHSSSDVTAEVARLCAHCALDKKVAKGETLFVLPRRIGCVEQVRGPDAAVVRAAFASCLELS